MKKIILILVALFTFTFATAQSWTVENIKGDELKGTKDCVAYFYQDAGKSLYFDSDNDKIFVLTTPERFFKYSNMRGTKGHNVFMGIAGLYSSDDKLIERLEITFEVMDEPARCYPNKYTMKGGNNYKRSRRVVEHLKNSDGYVRFLLGLYPEGEFELKVPHLDK